MDRIERATDEGEAEAAPFRKKAEPLRFTDAVGAGTGLAASLTMGKGVLEGVEIVADEA